MDIKEEINELFFKELDQALEGKKLIYFPEKINVEQDDIPDIERWEK